MENLYPTIGNVTRIEYGGQPVITTAQLAEFYSCDERNISDNFKRNEERFINGKHFFKLEGDDLNILRSAESGLQISTMTRALYLWTKRGAARHAKMLNNNKAWEVFEELEVNYFDRPAISDNQPANLECERLILERDRLNFEREQFKETNTIAKAQLLRELASASKDDVMRNDLVRYAAKLLIGEDFVTKKSCVNKILV